jgi:hypothetical protein
MRLKTPLLVTAKHAPRFEIRHHREWPHLVNWRVALGSIEAHHPDRPGAPRVVPEDAEIIYQMTGGGIAALAASVIEGSDILLPLELIGANGIQSTRQVKLVCLTPAIVIHVGPIIYH